MRAMRERMREKSVVDVWLSRELFRVGRGATMMLRAPMCGFREDALAPLEGCSSSANWTGRGVSGVGCLNATQYEYAK